MLYVLQWYKCNGTIPWYNIIAKLCHDCDMKRTIKQKQTTNSIYLYIAVYQENNVQVTSKLLGS